MVKDWYVVEDARYVNEYADGTPTGRVAYDDTYYFDEETGAMVKGEAVIDGKICYFNKISGVGT